MGNSYLEEIKEQPEIIRNLAQGLPVEVTEFLHAVRSDLARNRFDRIVITGMGGSLFGSYAAYLGLANAVEIPVMILDSSELTQQLKTTVTNATLLIVVSQSGESGEIRELVDQLAVMETTVISVTNMADNSLSNSAKIAVCSNAGTESTVSTKSYTGGVVALHLLVSFLTDGTASSADDDIKITASACAEFIANWEPSVNRAAGFLGRDDPIIFVGRGVSFASAQIAALLTQEAAKRSCTALTGGQFRHGPIELAREGFLMCIFLGDPETRAIDEALIEKVTGHGGKVLIICPSDRLPVPGPNRMVLTYPPVSASMIPVLEVIPIQLLQIPLSISRGFEPGAFLNASKITAVA